jgi:hypothetical protein
MRDIIYIRNKAVSGEIISYGNHEQATTTEDINNRITGRYTSNVIAGCPLLRSVVDNDPGQVRARSWTCARIRVSGYPE